MIVHSPWLARDGSYRLLFLLHKVGQLRKKLFVIFIVTTSSYRWFHSSVPNFKCDVSSWSRYHLLQTTCKCHSLERLHISFRMNRSTLTRTDNWASKLPFDHSKVRQVQITFEALLNSCCESDRKRERVQKRLFQKIFSIKFFQRQMCGAGTF